MDQPRLRRWIGIFPVELLASLPNLVAAIQRDDSEEILALIEEEISTSRADVIEFRRSHLRLDRLRAKVVGSRDEFERLVLDETLADWEIDRLLDQLEDKRIPIRGDDAAELEWYEEQLGSRLRVLAAWRRRRTDARDVGGVELKPVHDRD